VLCTVYVSCCVWPVQVVDTPVMDNAGNLVGIIGVYLAGHRRNAPSTGRAEGLKVARCVWFHQVVDTPVMDDAGNLVGIIGVYLMLLIQKGAQGLEVARFVWFAQVVDTPVMDDAGNLVGIIGVSTDITDLKKKEEEILRLNAELEARVLERTQQLERSNALLRERGAGAPARQGAPAHGRQGTSLYTTSLCHCVTIICVTVSLCSCTIQDMALRKAGGGAMRLRLQSAITHYMTVLL